LQLLIDLLKAFLVGGLICVVGQLLLIYTNITSARILVLFVTAGVVLGAMGWYQPLIEWGGAGATVPLVGFGVSLAKGAIQAVREDGIMGALTGGVAANAAGIAAAIVFGYLMAVLFTPKIKG
jgi:stage V sporulation protein AE